MVMKYQKEELRSQHLGFLRIANRLILGCGLQKLYITLS
jgi:hypothetical protein